MATADFTTTGGMLRLYGSSGGHGTSPSTAGPQGEGGGRGNVSLLGLKVRGKGATTFLSLWGQGEGGLLGGGQGEGQLQINVLCVTAFVPYPASCRMTVSLSPTPTLIVEYWTLRPACQLHVCPYSVSSREVLIQWGEQLSCLRTAVSV